MAYTSLLDDYKEDLQQNNINNNQNKYVSLLDGYVEPESVKEPSFAESHPMLASIPGKVGNAFNNVSNAIQTGLNKYGEAQALNGQVLNQNNDILSGGIQKIAQPIQNTYDQIANKPINLMPSRLLQPVTNAFSGVGQVASNVLPFAMGGYYNSPTDVISDVKREYNRGVDLAKQERQLKEMNPTQLAESLVDMYLIGKMMPGNNATMLGRIGTAGKVGGVYGGLESLKENGLNPVQNLKDASRDALTFMALEPLAELGVKAINEGVERINPSNYKQIIESVPKNKGMGMSQRTVYEPKVKYEYKPQQNVYSMKDALGKPRIETGNISNSTDFTLGEGQELKYGITKPIKQAEKKTVVNYLAPNIAAKQANLKAEKTNQIADTSKMVNSNEEKIAKLESKIQMVGKDTMLGKKYQAQIDELRGTVQPSEQVSEQVKQEIISQDYKDSVKEYTQEQHKNSIETYGNKMADAAKKANAGIGKDDNGQQYNENKQKFEEYKALKDYHEEQIKPQEIDFNKINNGAIWKNETWGNIFNKLKEKNDTNKYWIEKVNKSGDSLLSDDVFSHYQLKSEEGYKVKIPSEYNEYIKNTFNDDKYIGTVKPQEATVSKTENVETTPTNEENSVVEEKPVVRENSTTENTVNSNRKYTYDVGNLKVKNGLTIPQREEIIETILNEYKGNLYPDVETKYIFDRIKNPEIENDTYIKEVEKDIIPINIKGSRISYNIYKNPQSIRIFLDKLGIKIKDNIAGAEQYTNPKNVKLPKFIKEHHNYINDYIYDGDYISDGSFAIKKEYANITDKNLLEKIINNDITKDFNVSKIIQTSGTKPLEDLNKLTKLEDGNLKLRIYKNAKGNNVYVDEKYAKLFDNAILEQHDFEQIIARDKDGNIIGLVMPIQEKAGAKFSSPIPAMNQKTFMSKHKGEYPHIKQQNKQEIKKSNTEFNQIGKENEVSGSRTEDVKVYTDLLHDKLSKVLGIPKETLDKSLTVKETNEVKYADDGLNQSAMYKSNKNNFDDFYDYVINSSNPKAKSYFTINTKDNVDLDIIHDIIRHDKNKHSLSKEQWKDLLDNIDDNIIDKKYAFKSYYNGIPILLKIKTPNNLYGVSVEIFPNRNIITTAFASTEKGLETWFEKDNKRFAKTTAPNLQSGSSATKSNNVILGQTINNIITKIKENFKPNTLNQTQDITKTENFKKWFKDSKVVDKKGNPLVVYHGTNSRPFSIFGENQRGWSTEKKRTFYFSASKKYSDTFAKGGEYGQVMEVYLSLKNPLVIPNDEIEDVGYWLNDKQLDELEAKGYDGFITEDKEQIVVLHPEQIKSVYNNGLFDSNNPNIYKQNNNEIIKGSYNPQENIIEFFKGADESTSTHEVAHYMLETWNKYASESKEIADDLAAIRDFVGNKGEQFTEEQHEKFARGFERYIRDGKAATSKLKQAFERFKEALKTIYKSIKEIFYKSKGKNKYFSNKEMNNINEVFNRIFTTAKERADLGIKYKNYVVETPAFKKWSNNAPYVSSEEALTYNFKTGEKVVAEAFHGTKRADRVGSVFLPGRATSGPMAMFSSNREISEGYAKNKSDTSISAYEDTSYSKWFKININGRKYDLDNAWWNLSSEQREKISKNAPHITNDDMAENIIYDENINRGLGNYDYVIKKYRGNALKALVDGWLEGGNLYNKEEEFQKVLELSGINKSDIIFDSPYAEHPGVYDVYIQMQKPLVTNDIPQEVISKLEKEAKKQPIPNERGIGVDLWDKNVQNPNEWISILKEDYKNGENSFAWSSIPDWVTNTLKSFGYDGIIDVCGKSGGEIHKVYIPFASEQIKSFENKGTFDSNNPNIYYQTGKGATNKIEQSVRDFDIENVDEILKKVKKEPDEVFKNIFTPISSRLDEISPSLKHAIRKFELNSALAENKSAEIVKPFIEKLSKMDKVDYAKYDLALKNGNKEVIDKINSKYNIGDDYKSIKKLLSNIRQEAIQNGLEVGEIEDYFPRKVINPSALLEEYSKSSYIKNYLKEIDPNNKLTTEEKINKINTALKGYNGAIKASSSFTKGRKISEIDKNLNRYYKDSKEALVDYITSMNNAIQTRKFFGNSEENIENSIGAFTKNLIDNGIIKPSDEVKLKKLLTSRFTQRSMHGAIKSLKNVGYITTMGNPLSAVTQLGDFAFSLYKNGIINTLSGVKDSVFKTDKITKKDLGIDRIAQEFENDCKTGKIVDKVFKIVGLNKIDSLAKETFINGAMNRNKKSAINALENINSKEAKEYYNYLHNIFGNETYNVLEDLKNEKLSDNVKYLLFSEISDFQPISLSEMPEAYLKSGNGRIFYMLKTYSIKLLDVYRNETYRQFKAGNKKKSIANLIKLGFYLTLLGVTSDKIKDKMLGRDSDIGDTIVDNILKMAMFSKYQLDKSKTEGIGKTIYSNILPPSGFIDDVWKDVQSVAKDNYNIKDFKTFRNIPVIGKMYYWWFGGGVETRDKEAKSKYKNEYKKAIEKNNIKLEEKIDKELSSKGYSKKETDKIYKNASQSITKMYVNQYYKAMKNNSDKGISSIDKKLKKLGYTQDEIDYFYNKAYDKYDKELYEE